MTRERYIEGWPSYSAMKASARMRRFINLGQARRRLAAEVVTEAHPNWTATVHSHSFAEWLKDQPEHVQAWATSEEPADAVRLLDLYAGYKRRVRG